MFQSVICSLRLEYDFTPVLVLAMLLELLSGKICFSMGNSNSQVPYRFFPDDIALG